MSNEYTAEGPLTATVAERLGEKAKLDELRSRPQGRPAGGRPAARGARWWWAAGAALGTLLLLDRLSDRLSRARRRLLRRR